MLLVQKSDARALNLQASVVHFEVSSWPSLTVKGVANVCTRSSYSE